MKMNVCLIMEDVHRDVTTVTAAIIVDVWMGILSMVMVLHAQVSNTTTLYLFMINMEFTAKLRILFMTRIPPT